MSEWPDWLTPILVVSGGIAQVGIGIWVGHVNADRKSFREVMRSVGDKLDTILSQLPPKTIERNSPLQLNDLDKRVANAIAAERWAANECERLLGQVEGVFELYRLDRIARRYVDTNLTDSWQEQMHWAAYEFGISQRDVLAVLHIVLRDELISRAQPLAAAGTDEGV